MNKQLIAAVIKQLGGRESLKDIAEHSADAGWPGFSYYSDTFAFYRANQNLIVEAIETLADDLEETPVVLVAGFGCFRDYTGQNRKDLEKAIPRVLYGQPDFDQEFVDEVANALAWFALEEVARYVTDNQ